MSEHMERGERFPNSTTTTPNNNIFVADSEAFPDFPAEPVAEIASSNSTTIYPVPPNRRHRRSRQSVRAEDIEDFRADYFGEATAPELERAFEQAKMSFTSGNNNATGNANNNATAASSNAGAPYNNFFEHNNSANATGMAPVSRPSSASSTPRAATPTGNGGSADMGAPGPVMPQNAGQPMDLNHLYAMVLELSDVLKNNREMTRGIINGAEELMVRPLFLDVPVVQLLTNLTRQRRSANEGQLPSVQEANSTIQGNISRISYVMIFVAPVLNFLFL